MVKGLGDGGHSWTTSLENNNPICFVNRKLVTTLVESGFNVFENDGNV